MNHRMGSSLALVAVAVLVAFGTMSTFDNSATGQDKDNRIVPKWEYRLITKPIGFNSRGEADATKKLEQELNTLGQDGWEVVETSPLIVLKRPLK